MMLGSAVIVTSSAFQSMRKSALWRIEQEGRYWSESNQPRCVDRLGATCTGHDRAVETIDDDAHPIDAGHRQDRSGRRAVFHTGCCRAGYFADDIHVPAAADRSIPRRRAMGLPDQARCAGTWGGWPSPQRIVPRASQE